MARSEEDFTPRGEIEDPAKAHWAYKKLAANHRNKLSACTSRFRNQMSLEDLPSLSSANYINTSDKKCVFIFEGVYIRNVFFSSDKWETTCESLNPASSEDSRFFEKN